MAIYPDHRQFLRFEGTVYEYLVLLSLTPRTFTKCVKAALALLRKRGIRVLSNLDGGALIASQRAHRAAVTSVVTRSSAIFFCEFSDMFANPNSFLSSDWKNVFSWAYLSEHRVADILSLSRSFSVGTQIMLWLMGMMVSMVTVVPLSLLKMQAFQHWTLSSGGPRVKE